MINLVLEKKQRHSVLRYLEMHITISNSKVASKEATKSMQSWLEGFFSFSVVVTAFQI